MSIDSFRFNLKLREHDVIGTKMLKKLLISILNFLITLIIILKIYITNVKIKGTLNNSILNNHFQTNSRQKSKFARMPWYKTNKKAYYSAISSIKQTTYGDMESCKRKSIKFRNLNRQRTCFLVVRYLNLGSKKWIT